MIGAISRRQLVAAGIIAPLALNDLAAAPKSRTTLTDAAFLFGFPAFEMARLAARARINEFTHRRVLADHTSRAVTMPNNDTLYSQCRFDLSVGFIDLDIPEIPDRYFSVALMDAFTNNVAVLGQTRAMRYRIVGPKWRGQSSRERKLVRMPTNDGWLLGRTFVNGPDDLQNARLVQDSIGFRIERLRDRISRTVPTSAFDAENFIAVVNDALVGSNLDSATSRKVARFEACGFRRGGNSPAAKLPAEMVLEWRLTMERMQGLGFGTNQLMGPTVNGWAWPDRRIGTLAATDALRASVALSGIGALPSSEALYLTAVSDHLGQGIRAGGQYSLTLPNDDIADAFWSLSAYQGDQDGRFLFSDNAIHRYAINSATPSLQKDENGRTKIHICAKPPKTGLSNWLPLPTLSPRLVLRVYRPRRNLRQVLAALEASILPTTGE